jgi:N-succinyldiaminopimelate aminotransferase
MQSTETLHAFRSVPKTGVIYVTQEAAARGFRSDSKDWCNLGQGQPETGPLEGGAPRIVDIAVAHDDHEYAPVHGLPELRHAVAQLYNHLYRRGKRSQYSADNVSISGGGRISLARAAAALGNINLGHFLPDYTAYEELLDVFKAFTPIPIALSAAQQYSFSAQALGDEIQGRGLSALLFSNPCNPTGKLICGAQLDDWVTLSKRLDCALLVDEFYSRYCYLPTPNALPIESAARCVEDVDRDGVVIFDGLTKNWRYPGWRISWTLGPRKVIEAVASAGSFLDGGGNRAVQRAAVNLMKPDIVEIETLAIHRAFQTKRDRLLEGLRALGIRCEAPEGTFYVWGDISQLPAPLNDAMTFFETALKHQVIVVPGAFFDVNPGKRRNQSTSRFRQHLRFSFGPEMAVLELALQRFHNMLDAVK